MDITSHFARSARHTTHYLAAGPADGPLLIFVRAEHMTLAGVPRLT